MNPEKIYDFTLGIVGGGQLGKMLVQQAKTMGMKVIVLDPTPASPAGEVSDVQLVRNFFDREGFMELARNSDIITYEFEHISSYYLYELENMGFKVRPSSETLEIIQHKRNQKEFLQDNNIPVVSFACVNDFETLKAALPSFSLPIMLKSSMGGYDGKGNCLIEKPGENILREAYDKLEGDENSLYLEDFIDFKMELSVMAARNSNGQIINYPVVKNIHEESILHSTAAPARLPDSVKEEVEQISREVMELFQDIGIFGLEFFVDKDDSVYVNEIAPRPHNSGHYTIEACSVSQFETHLRAILDLPLKEPRLITPAVMVNLLGERDKVGRPVVKGLDKALEVEGFSFHFYRKKQSKPNRKMGHFTVTADSLQEAERKAKKAYSLLKITGE